MKKVPTVGWRVAGSVPEGGGGGLSPRTTSLPCAPPVGENPRASQPWAEEESAKAAPLPRRAQWRLTLALPVVHRTRGRGRGRERWKPSWGGWEGGIQHWGTPHAGIEVLLLQCADTKPTPKGHTAGTPEGGVSCTVSGVKLATATIWQWADLELRLSMQELVNHEESFRTSRTLGHHSSSLN